MAAAVHLTGLSGCGGDSGPPRTPVSGTVTYNGQPVPQGIIQFLPAAPSSPDGDATTRPATAVLNSDGTYTMGTFATGDGVLPGEYAVVINTRKGDISPEDPDAPEEWIAPEKYGNPVQSDLTASVPADGNPINLDFDLKD